MRKCRSTIFHGLSACLAILFVVAQPSGATTIDPLTWEQLVLGADCVAVVECVTAGGIVAKYKVLESFKGPAVGTEISLRIAINFWEPQFPIVLVGEQFFVTAYKCPPFTMMSTSSGSPVPLWWRKIPADYSLPLFQGRIPMAYKDEVMKASGLTNADGVAFSSIGFDGKDCKGFDEFRQAVRTVLTAAPERQELARVRSVCLKALLGGRRVRGLGRGEKRTEAMEKIAAAPDLPQLIDAVLQLAQSKDYDRLPAIVARYGRENTLKCLEALPRDKWPEGPQAYDKAIDEMRTELKAEAAVPSEEEEKENESTAVPDEKKLAVLRKDLEGGHLGTTLVVLCKHDPAAVAKYLLTWKNPQKDWRDVDSGYWLGSLFAHLCGKDRATHLRTLLGAQDPYIRVAGAVYLCFENQDEGLAELKKFTALEGDPGVWAALTLARRGDTSAVPRAIKVFVTYGESGMAGVPHLNLQKRLMVLMSNSAKASGVEQPKRMDADSPAYPEPNDSYEYYSAWWEKNKTKIKLTDPWMEMLSKQKVD